VETYAQVLSIAIPFFVGLIIIESIVAYAKNVQVNRPMDTISSLSSGMTFTLKNILGLTVVILSYGWMVDKLSFFNLPKEWWIYVLAFVGLDFAGYWQHRFNHSYNILWNRHIIHHSSEEFNLSCALRQNISVVFQIYFFLYIPMALIGVPVEVVATIAPIHFFAQFWYHTRLIDKMGFLEYIIVTPSHHRVHHAINDEYIDKNFSEIFIVWDKLFGTYQAELEDVPAVYGTKKAANTWNPAIINFMHLWQLIKDAWRTNSFADKFRIWFMPTGWRPEDVAKKYPLSLVDAKAQVKYDTDYTKLFLAWIFFQFVIANVIQYYLLISVADLDYKTLFVFALFVFSVIFAYSSLMDKHPIALLGECAKIVLGIYLAFLLFEDGTFGSFHEIFIISLGLYLLTSLIVTLKSTNFRIAL